MGDAKIWEWAGISLGDFDTLLLQKSIKLLSAKTGAGSIRFWGKISGTKADYYIAEATLEGGEAEGGDGEEGDTEPTEPRGTGIN